MHADRCDKDRCNWQMFRMLPRGKGDLSVVWMAQSLRTEGGIESGRFGEESLLVLRIQGLGSFW